MKLKNKLHKKDLDTLKQLFHKLLFIPKDEIKKHKEQLDNIVSKLKDDEEAMYYYYSLVMVSGIFDKSKGLDYEFYGIDPNDKIVKKLCNTIKKEIYA
jgi:hypothetical protein